MTRIVLTRKVRVVAPPALPAWLQGAAVNEWVEIAGSRFDQSAAITGFTVPFSKWPWAILAYSGGTVKHANSELFIAGGGHTDSADNTVYSIPLGDNAPVWIRHNTCTPQAQILNTDSTPALTAHYEDGRPISRHTYWNMHFDQVANRILFPASSASWGEPANGFPSFDAFDVASGDYVAAGTYASGMPSNTGCPCVMDGSGNIWLHNHNSGNLHKWTRETNTISTVRTGDLLVYETKYCVDTTRNRMLRLKNQGIACGYFDLGSSGAPFTAVTLTGPAASTLQPSGTVEFRVEMVYDTINDAYFVMPRHQNILYRIDAETFYAEAVSVTGVSPSWEYEGGFDNVYGRFAYCPELKGIVLMVRHNKTVKFIRTA